MNKTLFRSALVAGFASAASLGVAPAHAQFTGCGASSTSAVASFSSLVSGGATSCQVGDKIYSDFVFTIGTTDPNANILLGNPLATPEQHTLVASANSWTNGTFNYKVSVAPSAAPLQIKGIKFDTQSSLISPGYTWTAAAPELGANVTLSQTTPSSGALMGGPSSVINISHTLTNTGDPLQGWTDSIVQTPGPLPILGAGAAFGFSRKLRRRIKASV
jgi:hypothetical protein